MSKISNCFKMLEILSSGNIYSIMELSNELEMSPRMTRQYKDELEKAGIYISSIRGPHGGYYLDLKYTYPVRGLSKTDISILKRALNSIKNKSEYKKVLDKINSLQTKKVISNEDKKMHKSFSDAINNKNKIRLIYTSSRGNTRERIVEPLDFLVYSDIWYLLVFCETKQGLRRLRFNGISKYEIIKYNCD